MNLRDAVESPMELPEQVTVSVVRLGPGDVVVIKSPQALSDANLKRLKELAETIWSRNKCVVVDGGLSIEVLKAEPAS